jgi:hypothetical protein
MTKTTYVFRDGELVEKQPPQAVAPIYPLPFDIQSFDKSELFADVGEWKRQHLNVFYNPRLPENSFTTADVIQSTARTVFDRLFAANSPRT